MAMRPTIHALGSESPWPHSPFSGRDSTSSSEISSSKYTIPTRFFRGGVITHFRDTNQTVLKKIGKWIETARKIRVRNLFHNIKKDENYYRQLFNRANHDAAEACGRRQIQNLVKEWLNKHNELRALDKGVNPVFSLGYEKYLQADELHRKILTLFSPPFPDKKQMDKEAFSTAIKAYKSTIKKIANDNAAFFSTLKKVLEKPDQWSQPYLRMDDLHNLKALLQWHWEPTSVEENEQKEFLVNNIENLLHERDPAVNSHWISKVEFLRNLIDMDADEETLPKIAKQWLASYPIYLRISEINVPQLCNNLRTQLSPTQLPTNFENILRNSISQLDTSYANNVGLDRKNAAIFKTGEEAFLEQQPVFIAKLLNLSHIVVDGEVTTLDQTTGNSCRTQKPLENPVGNIQRFITGGVTPANLRDWMRTQPHQTLNIYKNINLQNYQETALFCAITKQGDMHGSNAFLLKDNSGKWYYKLFDIGRCLPPNGYMKSSKGVILTLRSFVIPMKQFRQPLTEKTMDLILSWDIEAFEKHFIIDERRNEMVREIVKDIKSLEHSLSMWRFYPYYHDKSFESVRDREKQLNELLSSYISEERFKPMVQRLKTLQNTIKKHRSEDLPAPTMRQCYKALFPMEMDFLRLYAKAMGDEEEGAPLMGYKSVEQILQIGIKRGNITPEEERYWLAKRDKVLHDPNLTPMRHWYFA